MATLKLSYLFAIPLVVTSCFYKKTGPYGVKFFDELKSKSESHSLHEYNEVGTIYSWGTKFSVKMTYNLDTENIEANEISPDLNTVNNKDSENFAKVFLDNYYFITLEKLSVLFPPENVDASYQKPYKNRILIKTYNSENDKNNNNYHCYIYSFDFGFFFLQSYSYFVNGRFSSNSEIIFNK